MSKGIEIAVKYRGFVRQSDRNGLFLSWCPLLDIKSQGRTIEEARASLDDSVRLFVVHCFRRGILEEALKRRGLKEERGEERASKRPGESGEHISVRPVEAAPDLLDSWDGEVPLNLVLADQNGKSRGDVAWPQ